MAGLVQDKRLGMRDGRPVSGCGRSSARQRADRRGGASPCIDGPKCKRSGLLPLWPLACLGSLHAQAQLGWDPVHVLPGACTCKAGARPTATSGRVSPVVFGLFACPGSASLQRRCKERLSSERAAARGVAGQGRGSTTERVRTVWRAVAATPERGGEASFSGHHQAAFFPTLSLEQVHHIVGLQ